MADVLRLAMIGCGDISQQYLKAAGLVDCAEVVVVMDAVEAHAEKLGKEYDTNFTTDYEAALARDDVDAVMISTPHYLHKPLTIQAAKAGKHVLCDKPIATNVADAQEMIDECKRAGVALSVNFLKRHMSSFRKAKELFDTGIIGEVIYILVDERGFKPESYWTDGWSGRVKTDWRRSRQKAGGGILIMNAIHTIDVLRYITKLEPVRISALVDTFVSDVEVEDTVSAVMKLDNGAMMTVLSASSLMGAKSSGTTIHGRLGQIQLSDPIKVFTTRTDTEFAAEEWTEVQVPKDELTYVPYLKVTCRAILDGSEVPIPGTEGLKTLAVVTGIYESSRTGKPVTLGDET